MEKWLNLLKKDRKKVIGILSGTSVDAVDIVLVDLSGTGLDTRLDIMDFKSFPITRDLREYILECSHKNGGNVEDICRINFLIGHLFSDSVKKFLELNNLTSEDIDLIGSHGQTIHHLPEKESLFGFKTGSTLQAGDPSVIANLTGINTVGDFRTADMSVNGEGAPLVPYLDYIVFCDAKRNRVLINIGGISNITFLKCGTKADEVIAFDTGPGNMLMDYVMQKLFYEKYDDSGNAAAKGKVNKELFDVICNNDSFYNTEPPKSTGREFYGEKFGEMILGHSIGLPKEDVIRTVTEYTAYTISHNIESFVSSKYGVSIDEIIASGGGTNNKFLLSLLKEHNDDTDINIMDYMGINPDNKEAVLFAVLANEAIHGNSTNLCSVSGADKNVILGKICLAS